METFEDEKPKKWRRYIGDVIAVVKRYVLNELLAHLNSCQVNIKFTVEVEQDGRLPMMDVILHRVEENDVQTTVIRKPTHTERYLTFASHHPPSMKRAVVTSLPNRVSYISPELKEEKEREIKHVKEGMVAKGYPEACVERGSKTGAQEYKLVCARGEKIECGRLCAVCARPE